MDTTLVTNLLLFLILVVMIASAGRAYWRP
jgi:hypothetical protein